MNNSATPAPSSPGNSALSALADRLENSRDRYLDDFPGWVQARLAGTTWSKQAEIAGLLRTHKRVGVRSCHAAGKTWTAAAIACWWIDTHPPGEALVVSTAPSWDQVHGVLWEEIRRIHTAANLPGTILGSDRWQLDDGTLVGVGRRPKDESAWQGYHRKYVLVIIDEAAGVDSWVFTSMETITTGPECRILAISNPDDISSAMAKTVGNAMWTSVKIAAWDTPNFTGERVPPVLRDNLIDQEWVDGKRLQWGEGSPLWRSKIEAEFADTEDSLIPYSWITAAQARWRDWYAGYDGTQQPTGRPVFGCDPAGKGRDRTAIAHRMGRVVTDIEQHHGLDTTQITDLLLDKLAASVQGRTVVDMIGLGTGVVDQLRRAGATVIGFNGSRATTRTDSSGDWRFPNLRSASWYNVRELLDPALDGRLCLPPDDDLAAELCAPRYDYRAGHIIVEPKDDTKRRIGRSPDLADAVVYSCWTERGDADRDHHDDPWRLTRRRTTEYAAAQFGTSERRRLFPTIHRDIDTWRGPKRLFHR